MLVSGLILILTETALFLAFHERRALDSTQQRALRDGARLVRLYPKIERSSFDQEIEATRAESGVNRITLASEESGTSALPPLIERAADGSEVIAHFALPNLENEIESNKRHGFSIHLDLAGPLAEARAIAKTQALVTATVLCIGTMLLWVVLDTTIAKRAETIMAGARAMTTGKPPGIELGGDDELAQIDRALRAAHATIHEQAADLQIRAALLAEKNQERSRLQQEIIQISEREQQRFGNDLHDDVCQRLAAVRMKIQDHEEKLAETAPILLNEAGDIASDLADAIHITRTLARGLSPVAIESGGFDVAMKGLARGSSAVFGIDCQFESDDKTPAHLPHSTAHQLYRIAQECISNAAKHARSQHVTIELQTTPEQFVMRIRNDGTPMPTSRADNDGMGMTIMRHRAESVGAVIEYETQPPDATTAVRCVLPLPTLSLTDNQQHEQKSAT
jgi:signal transduction histidine kinase